MESKEKLTFLKKIKISIFDFEKYQELATENVLKTLLYITIILIVFCLVIAGVYTYKFVIAVNDVRNYISENVDNITYENNILNVVPKNGEEITKIDNEMLGIRVIINTQTNDNQKIEDSINEIKSIGNGILILKDKVMIKNELLNVPVEYSYKDVTEQYDINVLNKQEVLDLLTTDTMKPVILMFLAIMLIYLFIVYLLSTIMDIVLLSIMAHIVALISKMRLKYSAVYNIATYSLTLPMILNIIYFIVNAFTGFTIKYFQVMYTTIASIYIVTAILMIRADAIKRQIQLTQILQEQEKIREELKRQEDKENEEDENNEEEPKKDDDKKNRKEDDDNLGNLPEGDKV